MLRRCRRKTIALVLGAMLGGLSASAGSPKEIESHLKAKYVGKVLTLRNFYTGEWLRYTKDGSLKHLADAGTWTLYSLIEVKKISMKGDRVEIRGNRRAILYEPKNRRLEQFRTGVPLRIEIEYGLGSLDEKTIEEAMTKVFLMRGENLADLVPPYWKTFLSRRTDTPSQIGNPVGPNLGPATKPVKKEVSESSPENRDHKIEEVYRVGGTVSAPSLTFKVDPNYTPEARAAKYQGTVVLSLVVRRDGTPADIQIVQPLGLGLDEEAIEAVQQWRFRPGLKDGAPVDVTAVVEVTFRLLF